MKRAGIYARFSSDLQNARSIDDQVVLCRALAERLGFTVTEIYADYAVSGASVHGRASYARLLADAESGLINVIIAEDMDRLSRNTADTASLYQRMEFLEVEIYTTRGRVTEMEAAVTGITNAVYLRTHAGHVHRGQSGRVRKGMAAGGLTYGYAPVPGQPGARVIVAHEAEIVRRIFAEYVAGWRPREIAKRLNAENINPPRGDDWTASTINGNAKRGSGFIANALYDGMLVWNKVAMKKDPATGKRVSRINPQTAWLKTPVPHLRIVDAETYRGAQEIHAERGVMNPTYSRKPKRLLSGLLRCASCGGGMATRGGNNRDKRIVCSRLVNGGRCEHSKTHLLKRIETRVVDGLKEQLRQPAAIARFAKTYHAERKRLAANASGRRTQLEKALAQVTRETERTLDAIVKGTASDSELAGRMAELRQRRANIESDLAACAPAPKVIALHPAAMTKYLAAIEDLSETLSRRTVEGYEDITIAFRELVAAVIVSPSGEIEVKGRLAALTGTEIFPSRVLQVVAEESIDGNPIKKPFSHSGWRLKMIWCPRHPTAKLIRTDLPNGKIELRCPECTEARRRAIKVVSVASKELRHGVEYRRPARSRSE